MSKLPFYRVRLVSCWTIVTMTILLVLFASSSPAQSTANIRGKVVDQLGSRIPDAKVVLVENDKTIIEGKSDGQGSFSLAAPKEGRYSLRVDATGFASQTIPFDLASVEKPRNSP